MLKRESVGTHLYASVILKETQAVIGTALMFNFDWEAKHAEIGYVFHRDYWNQGYGTETVALLNQFAFETLKLHKLHARVVEANAGSVRIIEKNGFELEGRLRDCYYIEGSFYDGLIFGNFNGNENISVSD
jgi:ribosomal-protein-alanine N-acetyltransferase